MAERAVLTLKNYFIPRPGNDHQPHILRSRVLMFVFIVMIVAEIAFLLGSVYVVPRIKLFGLIESTALIDQTNQQRVANGFAALTVSPLLEQVAQDKANDMAANSYFAHTSPSGLTPWSWFEKVGYQFSYAGENLAINFSNSQDVTNAWMNSPEHRANILNGAFTQIGMATAQGTYNGQPTIYVVEEFGTPASAPVSFVNTAAAASVGAGAGSGSGVGTGVAVNTAPSQITSKSTTTSATKPKPKPIIAIAPATVIASASVQNSSSQQLFVAVKGAETQTVPATTTAATETPVTATAATAATAQPQPQPSYFEAAIQWLASNPRAVANDFYIFLIALFVLASILNIFVKIRVQFPRLIIGGMTIVVVAGLFVMLNQNVGLLYAAII